MRYVMLFIIGALVFGAVGGCLKVADLLPEPQAARTQAPAGIMAAVQTATQPAPPTAQPTPTADALYIEQRRAELAAAQANEQAAKVKLDMAVRDAAETAVYFDALHAQETQAAQARATATADAIGKATQVSRSIMAQSTRASEATATAEAPRLEAEREIAAMMPGAAMVGMVIGGLILAFIGLLVCWLLIENIKSVMYARMPDEVEADLEPAQVSTVPTFAGTPGAYGVKVSTAALCRETGINENALLFVARRVMHGEALTHDNFTPEKKGNGNLSEGKLATLQFVLDKYKLAAWGNEDHTAGVVFTPGGWDWLRELTGATTPPPAQDAQKTPPAAQNDR